MKIAQRLIFKKIQLWAFFICIFGAQVNALAESSYWLCRRSMEVRTLRLKIKEDSCVAWYTKEGLEERIADTKDIELCKSIVSKIKGTLESAGWKCKDISNSQITE